MFVHVSYFNQILLTLSSFHANSKAVHVFPYQLHDVVCISDKEAVQALDTKLKEERKQAGEKVQLLNKSE